MTMDSEYMDMNGQIDLTEKIRILLQAGARLTPGQREFLEQNYGGFIDERAAQVINKIWNDEFGSSY
jgi:acyl-homoserine lactone acylase PvdQ